MNAPAGTGAAAIAGLVRLRHAGRGDSAALLRMFDRCSPSTRFRRFHGAVAVFPQRYLAEALSRSPVHHALVACAGDWPGTESAGTESASTESASTESASTESAGPAEGAAPPTIVALASCRVIDEGMAELGVLVEDAWQCRGVGTALLDELVAHARAIGLRALTAQLLADQAWAASLLARHGCCRLGLASRGVLTVTLRLSPA